MHVRLIKRRQQKHVRKILDALEIHVCERDYRQLILENQRLLNGKASRSIRIARLRTDP